MLREHLQAGRGLVSVATTRRQRPQDIYAHLLPLFEESASQYYGGNLDKGFSHWAFSLIFGEGHDITDNDVVERTGIDGADDFEIDGWFIPDAEDDSVVNLFQSKRREPGTNMGPNDLAAFLNAPNRITNAAEVAASNNEYTKELHDQLMAVLRESTLGCTVHLAWVTSGTLSDRAKSHARENATRTMTVNFNGSPIEVSVTLECLDLRDLYERYVAQQESDDSTTQCDVQFQLDPGTYHQTAPVATWRTLSMTVPVKHIIDAFRKHRYKIFQRNPRGPLGNKVNRQIKRTLSDPTERQRFHLVNNGLTAICHSWRLDEGDRLFVQNFQIVNGCQTTVTLWDTRALVEDDPAVMVSVKLVECPDHFAETIAVRTNNQATLKSEDLISNEPIQRTLQAEFSAMTPPWFYEIKRGEWSKMLGGPPEKERYRESVGVFRKLTAKDVAQAVLSFLGFPGEAKDRIRYFLHKDSISSISSEGEVHYDNIYNHTLTARQLLLPAVTQRQVWARVAADKIHSDWLDYARFHIVWLIGDILREHYKVEGQRLLTTQRSAQLAAEVGEWFEPLYIIAMNSIADARSEVEGRGQYSGHREFFRAPANYRAIDSKRQGALRLAHTFGNPTAGLPR